MDPLKKIPSDNLLSNVSKYPDQFNGKKDNFFSKAIAYMEKLGHAIIDVLRKEVAKKISGRHASLNEPIVLERQTQAHKFIQNMHYPLEQLDPEQRILLREMAAEELLPTINVANILPKRIREFIDLHGAYSQQGKILAPAIYKTHLEKILKLLITCENLNSNNTIRGDDFDLDLSRLTSRQKILFVEAVIQGAIQAEVLAKSSTMHLITYLDSLEY